MSFTDMQSAPNLTQKDMPYVAFETRTEEDAKASKAQGRMVFVDQDYARITPPGSRDVHYEKLPRWFDKLEIDYKSGRVMPDWVSRWKAAYEHYKQGKELPVEGTPIKGWNMLSGAQQQNVIQCNILTVETLATANAETLQRIGMGALDLKRRAEAWITQTKGLEPATIKMSALQRENDVLNETVKNLTEKVEALSKLVESKGKRGKEAAD
jgi:hypothetical protein